LPLNLFSKCSNYLKRDNTSYEYMLHINSIKQIEDIDTIENSFKDLRKTKRSQWCNDCHCTQLYDKFE